MDQMIHRMLKARNPDKKLWTESDLFQKQFLQIAIGHITIAGQFVKIRIALFGKDVLNGMTGNFVSGEIDDT